MRRNSGADDPERALEAGLRVLGERLGGGADELAAQLPEPYGGTVRGGGQPEADRVDDRAMAQAIAQRLGVEDAAALDVLQGTMRAVAEVADRELLKRLAAQLPASLKPAWDPAGEADRFRTEQADEGVALREGR